MKNVINSKTVLIATYHFTLKKCVRPKRSIAPGFRAPYHIRWDVMLRYTHQHWLMLFDPCISRWAPLGDIGEDSVEIDISIDPRIVVAVVRFYFVTD